MARATRVDFTGPFFSRDPQKTFRDNCRTMLGELANEAKADVIGQMRANEGNRRPIRLLKDRVADHVTAHPLAFSNTADLSKPRTLVNVNNSGFSRAEARSLMAAASEVEAITHAFRRTASRIKRSRKVIAANLTEGLE